MDVGGTWTSGDQEVSVRRITLIGKPGCHLCDDARAVIERVAREEGVEWEELNMLDDPELVARYAEQIPVTLVDGRQHDYWRVDENRLRKALSAPPRGA
ncbi:glutaredoxin family protein [Dermacoccus abyssi]|uniref:Glutaredoxin family protein n=1 Tax=Dermacoccus abyssi TaxID=322596 RepID=A0A417Z2T8_9MICO|nr:glutaredoxin family protein [Dermacoccus abyssi]RHW44716.1 glutaredoxin family protein [Dermacoccus abyssi]